MNSENMKKIILISVLITAAALSASAGEHARQFPRFTFGIEGSYIVTAAAYSHSNFIADDGYRVDNRSLTFRPAGNGELLLNAGCNFGSRMNLAFCSGISGISRGETVVPMSLRFTFFFGKDPMKARWFSFLDGGAGIAVGREAPLAPIARIGTGYRISLTRSAKLDFLMSLRGIYSHPQVKEIVDGAAAVVPEGRLRRSQAFYGALTFGIGLNF